MSVWDKVFKNTKSKAVLSLGPTSVSVPNIKLPKRGYQFPSLLLGIAVGTTYTKRTFFCQLGAEVVKWRTEPAEEHNEKIDLSVYRVEKVLNDLENEISLGEEALSNFMSDRGDPSCTLFLQPIRFLLSTTKLPYYVTTYDGQKIFYQSPTNKELYKNYIKSQFEYLWNKAYTYHSEIQHFIVNQIVVEYPDYFAAPDIKKYKSWLIEAAEEFFPPLLCSEEEITDYSEKFVLLPESIITLLHWLTDHIEPKLAAQDIELKKLLVRYGILPRVTDPINFLVVTMGATHSRVVKIRVSSIEHLASAKRVGENIVIGHSYLGRIGFGGDHISCAFLEEEEERRYGTTPTHRVSTLTRKVFEDWAKMMHPDGKKHFEELYGEQFNKAIEKLGELTLKGFGENPENTLIILGGKVFEIPYFRETFKNYLNSHRIPKARVVWPTSEEIGIERACEILQYYQKGLGRSFTVRIGLDIEGAQKFTWRIGKVVEGELVDTFLKPDNKEWNENNPREFKVVLEHGAKRINLGYQKTVGGISQLWASVHLTIKSRITAPIKITFKTEGPDDLKIVKVETNAKNIKITPEDFQIDMLIGGEHPSSFPLYEKILLK